MRREELNKIAEKLQILEQNELRDSGLKNIEGGYATINMYNYDDDIIDIEVEIGVQTGSESDWMRVENGKIDRATLERI